MLIIIMTIKVISMKVTNCKNAEKIRIKQHLLIFSPRYGSYWHPYFTHEYTNELKAECPGLFAAKLTLNHSAILFQSFDIVM